MITVLRLTKRMASLGLVLVAVAVVATTSTLLVGPQLVTIAKAHEGTAAELQLNTLAERSQMLAYDGSVLNLLAETENREPIPLDAIPQEVIDAILVIEDADFYEHDGVNLRATFRALVENVNAGGIAQGGSTITQQLVKNSILTAEQNLDRKTTEAFYALRLERQMTKDAILERYLNTVYFGSRAYGVLAAAETYWGYSSADQLGWAEAALLAGLIRNPNGFDPTRFPEAARERRAVVLARLVATGHLTQEQADLYNAAPLPEARQAPLALAPTDYFVQEALEAVLNDETILGGTREQRFNAVYNGGLKIYTTLDPKLQEKALQARADQLPNIKENCFLSQRENRDPAGACLPNYTVAIATVDPKDGAVRAMVGGRDFIQERFNLATQGLRQPGSSIKTFVLAAAFEEGYTPLDQVRTDSPCSFPNPGGTPNPYVVDKGSFRGGGPRTIAVATRASNNCAFVRLGQIVGNDKVVQVMNRLGIVDDLSRTPARKIEPVLSLPLGSEEVTPLEMAAAYAAFANDGVYNAPYYIDRIENRDGKIIYEHRPLSSRAVSTQTARLIAETLEGNVLVLGGTGTGARARVPGQHAAGKTGTTQNYEDAWFVGFTDYYATSVWLGEPEQKLRIEFPEWSGSRGRGGFGSEIPAAVWGAYMTAAHEGLESVEFAKPDPYRGGRYLKVDGERDFCDLSGFDGDGPRVTENIDSDNDGKADCVRVVAPTTAPPETQPSQPDNNNGGGNNGGGNNGGGGGNGNNGGANG